MSDKIKLLDKNFTTEFFVDITYKAVPWYFLPYRLMVISVLSKNFNKPKLMLFILLKYQDHIIY